MAGHSAQNLVEHLVDSFRLYDAQTRPYSCETAHALLFVFSMGDATKMACEPRLISHINCVKDFLRDANENNLNYEPGHGGEFDRCAGTRDMYVVCMNSPAEDTDKRWKDGKKIHLHEGSITRTQRSLSDSSKVVTGKMGQHKNGQETYIAKPCEADLVTHGSCVRNELRSSVSTGHLDRYMKTEDKCMLSRNAFAKCMSHFQGK